MSTEPLRSSRQPTVTPTQESLQILDDWVAGLSLDQVPGDVVQLARRCIVDTVGVAIAGSSTRSLKGCSNMQNAQYGSGPCDVLGRSPADSGTNDQGDGTAGTGPTGTGMSALGAALVNGVAAHALDFDDTSYAGVTSWVSGDPASSTCRIPVDGDKWRRLS